jgi:hypothetical protein
MNSISEDIRDALATRNWLSPGDGMTRAELRLALPQWRPRAVTTTITDLLSAELLCKEPKVRASVYRPPAP